MSDHVFREDYLGHGQDEIIAEFMNHIGRVLNNVRAYDGLHVRVHDSGIEIENRKRVPPTTFPARLTARDDTGDRERWEWIEQKQTETGTLIDNDKGRSSTGALNLSDEPIGTHDRQPAITNDGMAVQDEYGSLFFGKQVTMIEVRGHDNLREYRIMQDVHPRLPFGAAVTAQGTVIMRDGRAVEADANWPAGGYFLPNNPAPDFVDGGVLYMLWINSTVTEFGEIDTPGHFDDEGGFIKYGTPPNQDKTNQVIRIANTHIVGDDTSDFYFRVCEQEHVGNLVVHDVADCEDES